MSFLRNNTKIIKIKQGQLILLINYKIIITSIKKIKNISIKKRQQQSIYNNYIYAIGEKGNFYNSYIIISSDLFFFGYDVVQKINNLHKDNFLKSK